MRIAVDARPLAFPATGNATYLSRMLLQLMRLRPDDEWVLVSHRGLHPVFSDVAQRSAVELRIEQGLSAKTGPGFVHLRLPALLGELRCDLFWGTLAMLPFNYRNRCAVPAIVNFHDLNSYRAPETMPAWKRYQHRLLDGRTIAAAERVLCLSETTRQDILTEFPDTPAGKLRVVYPGAELPDSESRAPAGGAGRLSRFILCVGTLAPRKNQSTLLEAYLAARQKQELPPLRFAGRKGWGDESLYNRLSSGELEDQGVYYLEGASDGELAWCYEHCALVALPSIHEGFGLPVIEAFQKGRPALLSDIPIFRVVGGESMFVEPRSRDAWQAALIAANDQLRSDAWAQPDFDAEFWSWSERAKAVQEILEELERENTFSPPVPG